MAGRGRHEGTAAPYLKLIGMSIRDLLGKDLFSRNEEYIVGALAGQRQSFERTLTKPSGEVGHTWAQYIPDIANDGVVRGFFVLVTDVTELRKTTDALKAANAELEDARIGRECEVPKAQVF